MPTTRTPSDVWAALLRSGDDPISLAERQHGLVAAFQLLDLGLAPSQIHRLHLRKGWEQVTSDVLRRTGTPDTKAMRVVAAVLDAGPGAALSHESAASWWGHRSSRLENPIHVVTTRKTSRRTELARLHRVRRLEPQWVTDRHGVTVVRPELAALQLFAMHRPDRAERIVDSMWSQRLLSGRSIGRLLADLGKRGRDGTAGLRRYHRQRGDDYRPPDSGLESRVDRILRAAGIVMVRQVDVGGEAHWSGRVDFLHSDLPLVLEVQSELHHSSRTDRAADAARIQALNADGFEVIEVTDEMVWTDPQRVVEAVRDGLRSATSRSVPHPSPIRRWMGHRTG